MTYPFECQQGLYKSKDALPQRVVKTGTNPTRKFNQIQLNHRQSFNWNWCYHVSVISLASSNLLSKNKLTAWRQSDRDSSRFLSGGGAAVRLRKLQRQQHLIRVKFTDDIDGVPRRGREIRGKMGWRRRSWREPGGRFVCIPQGISELRREFNSSDFSRLWRWWRDFTSSASPSWTNEIFLAIIHSDTFTTRLRHVYDTILTPT